VSETADSHLLTHAHLYACYMITAKEDLAKSSFLEQLSTTVDGLQGNLRALGSIARLLQTWTFEFDGIAQQVAGSRLLTVLLEYLERHAYAVAYNQPNHVYLLARIAAILLHIQDEVLEWSAILRGCFRVLAFCPVSNPKLRVLYAKLALVARDVETEELPGSTRDRLVYLLSTSTEPDEERLLRQVLAKWQVHVAPRLRATTAPPLPVSSVSTLLEWM